MRDIGKPYLTIIVPIYNTDRFLKKCIDSILDQTYINYELILVDDGSSDSSSLICDYYARQDKRIHVIHKKNGGVTSARKAGLAIARGEYISFIDSDDWIEPDFYSALMDCCQSIEADMIVASGYQEEVWGRKIQNQKVHIKLRHGTYRQREMKQIMESGKIMPALWLKLFKRRLIIENIQLIDNRVYIGEDKLCSYACMLDAASVVIQNNYLYHYVQHEDSASHKYNEKKIRNVFYFASNLKKIRNIKNAVFLDRRWNQIILDQLLNVISCEFGKQKLLLSKSELLELKRKFKGIELSKLLIKDKCKMVISSRKMDEKLILLLYTLKCYQLLNLYMKIFIAQDNSRSMK